MQAYELPRAAGERRQGISADADCCASKDRDADAFRPSHFPQASADATV